MKDIIALGLVTVGVYYVIKMLDKKMKQKITVPEYNMTDAAINTNGSTVTVYQPSINLGNPDMDVVAWTHNENN